MNTDGSHPLAIVTNAAVNRVNTYLFVYLLSILSDIYPELELAVLCVIFLRICQAVFHSGWTVIYSLQLSTRGHFPTFFATLDIFVSHILKIHPFKLLGTM